MPTAPVTGQVTLDGQPVTSGVVTFVPEQGKAASGTIESDGSFTLGTYGATDGAIVGVHQVAIISQKGGIEEDSEVHYIVPKWYGVPGSSGLTFEVQPDEENVANFELTTEKRKR